jgi:hypothetical protein
MFVAMHLPQANDALLLYDFCLGRVLYHKGDQYFLG